MFKALLLAVTLLLTFSAHAASDKSRWDSFKDSRGANNNELSGERDDDSSDDGSEDSADDDSSDDGSEDSADDDSSDDA